MSSGQCCRGKRLLEIFTAARRLFTWISVNGSHGGKTSTITEMTSRRNLFRNEICKSSYFRLSSASTDVVLCLLFPLLYFPRKICRITIGNFFFSVRRRRLWRYETKSEISESKCLRAQKSIATKIRLPNIAHDPHKKKKMMDHIFYVFYAAFNVVTHTFSAFVILVFPVPEFFRCCFPLQFIDIPTAIFICIFSFFRSFIYLSFNLPFNLPPLPFYFCLSLFSLSLPFSLALFFSILNCYGLSSLLAQKCVTLIIRNL